ncbi:MAG: hypothetical protein RPU64_15990 [Candidatus Sedimenticola sp. (ex Thyasira tokunagai)]
MNPRLIATDAGAMAESATVHDAQVQARYRAGKTLTAQTARVLGRLVIVLTATEPA